MEPSGDMISSQESISSILNERIINLDYIVYDSSLNEKLATLFIHELTSIMKIPISWYQSGQYVTIERITLSEYQGNTLYLKMDLSYGANRGVPQYSTSGFARCRCGMIFTEDEKISLQNFTITELNLGSIPTSLDEEWIKRKLTSNFPGAFSVPAFLKIPLGIDNIHTRPNPVTEGEVTTCTVHLTTFRFQETEVSISNNNTAAIITPNNIIFPPGKSQVNFPLRARHVETTTNVTITASCNNTQKSVDLTINPVTLNLLKIDPPTVLSGESATCKIDLTGKAPVGGLIVALEANPSNIVTIPSSAQIPATASTIDVPLQTNINNTLLQTVTISASYKGVRKEDKITIIPRKANLVVDNIELRKEPLDSPSSSVPTRSVNICVIVRNVGTAPAISVSTLRVRMYKKGTIIPYKEWYMETPPLSPNESKPLCNDLSFVPLGEYDINAFVDINDVVNESDEANGFHSLVLI